jgi:hypothetical protein
VLLTIATTHVPATDLGYLLHKNPARQHTVALSFGTAHVIFPVAAAGRCEAAVVLEIDPIGLVRRSRSEQARLSLAHYVNDRPYAASSFLSVALGRLFGTALSGQSARSWPGSRCRWRSGCPSSPAGAGRRCSGGCSSRWATTSLPGRSPWIRVSPTGATAGTLT